MKREGHGITPNKMSSGVIVLYLFGTVRSALLDFRRLRPLASAISALADGGGRGDGERGGRGRQIGQMIGFANNPPKEICNESRPQSAQMSIRADGPSGLAHEPAQRDFTVAAGGVSAPVHDAALHACILVLEEKLMAAHRLSVQRSHDLGATPPAHKDHEAKKAAATSAQEALSNIEMEYAAALPMLPPNLGEMELDDGASQPQTA
ncbi:hypothetical protein BCON_0985g00010 [Botryotinia convoluta]|uniref:Uncharacterized protein n=1 Tax=Botryotinia convoluta TaxID=54673 RepID=A0A4Z1HF26_9HELO|nr:hypothetical protein BCON_0985g00010 [Botryotinia convoluta]